MMMKNFLPLKQGLFCLFIFLITFPTLVSSQHSVAREWNEVLLEGIRNDFARPTIHSRNLYHFSLAIYDTWAAYDPVASPFLLGRKVDGFILPFDGISAPTDLKEARKEAISYAAYRIIATRYRNSPGRFVTLAKCDSLMTDLGYDLDYVSTDYSTGNPAALGNYIAEGVLKFGLQDGSNEVNNYRSQFYEPINEPLFVRSSGNTQLSDPNRWQPLAFEVFIGQSGIPEPGQVPAFVSPEWGQVTPFALEKEDRNFYKRDGNTYWVYHDPGPPPYVYPESGAEASNEYLWGFEMVAIWSSHLDPDDGVMWDISPAAQGNNTSYPTRFEDYRSFYNTMEGGDFSTGHTMNPHTGQPYAPQIVPRGDYTRVLAEFWADGPDSETPPGHWFTILNYVNDHPDLKKRFKGEGADLDNLEWDVKTYFTLGGAMHDAAISAWGLKGYYDYLRPISVIRWLGGLGARGGNSPGFRVIPDFIEEVKDNDPLAVVNGVSNIGKFKLKTWEGPNAGVDWRLAEQWWPYQRPTFVTPPFAGYVSGHSTFSRAAAEVLTSITGDPFFPGGIGEFVAKKNDFLVFEIGPSTDIVLQWATYRDASDQTSLSRIWGGIHPPADDIPGRLIGEKVGLAAFDQAEKYFTGNVTRPVLWPSSFAYPNPVHSGELLYTTLDRVSNFVELQVYNATGLLVLEEEHNTFNQLISLKTRMDGLTPGIYIVKVKGDDWEETQKIVVY